MNNKIIDKKIIDKKIVIFCSPITNFLVSTDVISQYLFFSNTKNIFEKHNYKIIYFYDLLSNDESIKYKNIHENYKYADDYLTKIYKSDREKILKIIIDNNEYNDCILIGLESIGFDAFFYPHIYMELKKKNIIIIISIYDTQMFSNRKTNNYFEIIDKHCDLTTYIISSSYVYFKNINWKSYHKKCRKTYISFDPKNLEINNIPSFDLYFNRQKKILLNGSIDAYKYRKIIYNIINDQEYYIKYNTIYPENINNFKEIIQFENARIFNRKTKNLSGGVDYCKFISNYMGYFILFGTYPIDFPLVKIVECMLSGCLAFVEPKTYLYDELGLVEYEHYVPILIEDNTDKIILDIEYYNKYLNTELGLNIAKKGNEFIKKFFNDESIAYKYINVLNDIIDNCVNIYIFTDSEQNIFINDNIQSNDCIYMFKIIKFTDDNFEEIINNILIKQQIENHNTYFIFNLGNNFKFHFFNKIYFNNLINNHIDVLQKYFKNNIILCNLLKEYKIDDHDYLTDLLIYKNINVNGENFFTLKKIIKKKYIEDNLINLKNLYGTYNDYVKNLDKNNLKLKILCENKSINLIDTSNINTKNELYVKIIENINKNNDENIKIDCLCLNDNELIDEDLLKNIKFYQPYLVKNYSINEIIEVNIINDNKNNNLFGISFKLNENKIINNKCKCKLFFQAKIDSDILSNKLRIYNGYEWIIIDEIINNEYKDYNIIEYFNFNIINYRIGFNDWSFEYLNISIKNISLKYIIS
jgi:hypothetical protein